MGIIRFRRIRSNILERMGRRLIGRYDEGFWEGLPGFGKSIILENFQRRGKCVVRNIQL